MNVIRWSDGAAGFVNVQGKSLEYACFGASPQTSPTIIMLHEGLGCLALWRDFPKAIAQATGFGVFVFSRAGYGQSDNADLPRTPDYMSHEATKVLPKVLDAIGLQKGILLGHSDGATIAAIYAGSVVDHRVRGLILMAPHFFTEDIGLAEIKQAKSAFDTGNLRQKMAKFHKNPDNTFRGWNDIWLSPDFRAWNVSEVIDYLRIPVLALQGTSDQYGTLAQLSEIEDRIYSPIEIEVLSGCGHSPHLDRPQKTLDLVADFAARLSRIETEIVKIA